MSDERDALTQQLAEAGQRLGTLQADSDGAQLRLAEVQRSSEAMAARVRSLEQQLAAVQAAAAAAQAQQQEQQQQEQQQQQRKRQRDEVGVQVGSPSGGACHQQVQTPAVALSAAAVQTEGWEGSGGLPARRRWVQEQGVQVAMPDAEHLALAASLNDTQQQLQAARQAHASADAQCADLGARVAAAEGQLAAAAAAAQAARDDAEQLRGKLQEAGRQAEALEQSKQVGG